MTRPLTQELRHEGGRISDPPALSSGGGPLTRRELRLGSGRMPGSPAPDGTASDVPAADSFAGEGDATAARAARRTRGVLAEIVLWLAATAGLICIVLVVLALTAHITLIMFRTGSMSPTIPSGSVAIVQQIPASEVRVGDVVTVERPGQLPVTHRVRGVADGSAAPERLLTLRGDANAQDDPAPYPVTTVRIVRFAIPGLAPVIVAFSSPFVLGGLTLGATALVVWAFWPRGERRPRGAGHSHRGEEGS